MNTYQVRVKVEIVPCGDPPTTEPVKEPDGTFSITITESDADSIDVCERALLQATYPTLRNVLSQHMSDVSKKKALEQMTGGALIPNCHPYQVDGEIGRFEFITHHIVLDDQMVYNTSREFFPGLRYWERYRTSGFKELAYLYGVTEESYQKTSDWLNRTRYQLHDGTPARTLREQAMGEGNRLMQVIDQKAEQILEAHGFRKDGIFEGNPATYQESEAANLPNDRVNAAIAACQAKVAVNCDLTTNPVRYEAPEQTVNITIDDVGAKRQKATRTRQPQDMGDAHSAPHSEPDSEPARKKAPDKTPNKTTRKYVRTTVIHVEHAGQSYLLTGQGIKYVLSVLVAFLLNNTLLEYRLQFFTDGYTILHDAIRWCFSWYPNITIILDWYHLKEKCQVQLSLAMKGSVMRNEALAALLPLLWYGLVDQAIAYLNSVDVSQIKDPEAITKLIGYYERNRTHIPCYAVRKALGLRNSSQIGERMNGLLVSERQKHNGMSWSVSGSAALASLTALARNNEHARWFHEGTIAFKLAA